MIRPSIEVRNLTHMFPGMQAPVFENLSFSARAGQWLGVVGRNGAGKSTLIRILATLIEPSSGQLSVCGYDVRTQPFRVRRCVGVLLDEGRSFYYRLTAYQNLIFFAALHGLRGKAMKHRVEEVLALVGLLPARDVRFTKFSTGMRKRLALARSLLHDPPVYLLDEPTAHLDPQHQQLVWDLLADLRARGKIVLTTTHNESEIGGRADKVITLPN